jgi:hypothetical protein
VSGSRAVLLLAAALAACSQIDLDAPLFEQRDTPDSGAPDAWPLGPTFGSLNANVFRPRCTGPCHSGGDFAAGNFDMSGDTLASMINVPSVGTPTTTCGTVGLDRIEPMMPDQSTVYLKVAAKTEGTTPVCGEGMPQGINRAPLTPDEVTALRDWIAAGALPD